jgi:hypothetical protein
MFSRFILLVVISFGSLSVLTAQDAVTVDRVKFNNAADRWVEVEIELTCNGNPSREAVNKDFVENISIKPLLAYETAPGAFSFYTSQADIMIMEARDKATVHFYMPGPIMERDEIRGEPEYYYIEVSVGGAVLKTTSGAVLSSNISSMAMLDKMKARAQEQTAKNKNILIPSYFAPAHLQPDSRKEPVYIRRESKSDS